MHKSLSKLRVPILGLLALCAMALLGGTAVAQQPTQAQRNAVKAACRADFIANCSGVTPGGREALQCLVQHKAALSTACQKAITAITGAATPATPPPSPAVAPAPPAVTTPPATAKAAASPPTTAQRNAIKAACRSDFMAQCSGVTPGGQAALSCLQQHNASLSASCQQAVGALTGDAATSAAAAAAPPATAAPAMAPMRSFTPREALFIMRQSCGPDFRTYCRGTPLGGGQGIACLRQNMQRLSPSCQNVLTSGL